MAFERVIVGTYAVLADAHLATTVLRLEGIEGFIENEYLNNLGAASQPIVVKVREEDRDRAIEVLQQADSGLEGQIARGDSPVCPECGSDSTEVIRTPPDDGLARVLYGLSHDTSRVGCRCSRCRYEWDARW